MTAPDPTAGERHDPDAHRSTDSFWFAAGCPKCERERCAQSHDGHPCGACDPSPPAVAASTGTSEDVEALAEDVFGAMEALGIEDATMTDARFIADAVSHWLAAREAAARAEEREALVVLDGLLHRWETVPALRRATAAAEVRRALGEHLARAAWEAR